MAAASKCDISSSSSSIGCIKLADLDDKIKSTGGRPLVAVIQFCHPQVCTNQCVFFRIIQNLDAH